MSQFSVSSVDRKFLHDDNDKEISFETSYADVDIPVIQGGSVSDTSSENEIDGDSDGGVVSDCESVVTGDRDRVVDEKVKVKANQVVGVDGLVRLGESDKLFGIIEKKFVSRLSEIGVKVEVECVYRNLFNASAVSQAKISSFQIFAKALEVKNGEANVKYAWYGGSKDEIEKIVMHGFGFDNVKKNVVFGHGIVLSADHSPLESVESAIVDGDGMKHMLLCRVLLGKTEVVNRFSTQCHPSSDDFQSGVDDLVSPKKYVVWSSQMNTHILPEFVISFKTQRPVSRSQVDGVRNVKPVSPWIPIPDLIAALSKILPPKAIKEITQYRRSYIERKISRPDMIRGIRKISGDRMLLMVLKHFTEKRGVGFSGNLETRFGGFKQQM